MDGFPDRYNILPPPFERVLEVAQRFGRFMFGAIDAETAYPSEHRRIPEPQDGEALEPNLNGYSEIADSLRG